MANGYHPILAQRARSERQVPGDVRFGGFPAGARATVIPNLFFSAVLPEIDDPAELVVSCYIFFALARRRRFPRLITFDELLAEAPLRRALQNIAGGSALAARPTAASQGGGDECTSGSPDKVMSAPRAPSIEATLRCGLAAAAARGTLLRAVRDGQTVYLVHTEEARRALASGGLAGVALPPAPEALPDEPPPSIYTLYEENVGTISPLIADELRDAEASYPITWIIAAFTEAVANNKRSWRYIARILERWRAEGRTDATVGRDLSAPGRRRDLEGRYRGMVRH